MSDYYARAFKDEEPLTDVCDRRNAIHYLGKLARRKEEELKLLEAEAAVLQERITTAAAAAIREAVQHEEELEYEKAISAKKEMI